MGGAEVGQTSGAAGPRAGVGRPTEKVGRGIAAVVGRETGLKSAAAGQRIGKPVLPGTKGQIGQRTESQVDLEIESRAGPRIERPVGQVGPRIENPATLKTEKIADRETESQAVQANTRMRNPPLPILRHD